MEIEASLSLKGEAVRETDPLEPDRALARSIADGDADAWDRFFDRYSAWVYRFAYHHLNRNRADAEDLCSDILLTAARSMHSFDGSKGGLDAWLLGLARHRLARFCRRMRCEVPMVPDCINLQAVGSNADCRDPAEDAGIRDLVNRALASLPERQSSILVGKYVEGYSVEELARIHQTSSKAVESLLSRARTAFRSAFNLLQNSAQGGSYRG